MTQEVLAESVGKSRPHIANTMRLLNLPLTVRNEVRKGGLTPGHARALLSHPEPEKAALAVIARGLNVRQTEALSNRKAEPPALGSAKAQKDPETEALERDISGRLGLKVEISFDGKGGQVRLTYRSLDQLDGIVALLSQSS
jgi:ParB family chromosome partitioning protein